MTTKIVSRMMAQGSFGLYRINRLTGEQRGTVIQVWHVMRGDERVESFLTRGEARRFIDRERRSERRRSVDNRTADRIDGFDRDDLGESPDY